MEKSIKIILFIIVGIVVVNFVVTIFGNNNIKGIRLNLEKAKLTTDSALNELKYSKTKLDSIKADMLVFQSYINNIQKTVELNDIEKRLKDEKNAVKVTEFKENIKKLRSEIETDSLPDIDVITTKNN